MQATSAYLDVGTHRLDRSRSYRLRLVAHLGGMGLFTLVAMRLVEPLLAAAVVAVVRLSYKTMIARLSTYGPYRTQHNRTFSKLTPSAMISSPTVTVEETDGCSSNVGRARLAEDFRGMRGPDPESCGRAREPREVAHLVRRRTSLKTCSCVNLRVPVLGRPLEL